MPSGTLEVGQATVSATNSSLEVTARDRFELDATGAGEPWTIQSAGGQDTVVVRDGARLAFLGQGAGNDTFTFASPTGSPDYPSIEQGLGDNTLTLQCGDGAVDYTDTTLFNITPTGNDSISTNCPISLTAPAQDPQSGDAIALADLDVTSTGASGYLSVVKAAPFNAASVSGPLSGLNGIAIDTMQSRQLGPIVVDVTLSPAHPSPGPNGPRVVTQIDLDPDIQTALVGPDIPSTQPATVSVDATALHAGGMDSSTAIVLQRPTPQQDITLTGGTAGTRNFLLHFPDPTLVANTGVPALASDGPVDVTLIVESCATMTFHAKSGSGRSDVTITQASCQAANFQPVNNVAFRPELPFYEGLTITWPSGGRLEMGFNGGTRPNRATLTIQSLVLGQAVREDVASGVN